MPTLRIPIDLAWGGGVSGSPGANVWHGRGGDPLPDNADLQGLVDFLEAFYTSINSLFCADWTATFAGEAQGVGADAGNTYTADPWTVTGTSGLDHLAPALQMLVNWRTPSGGRQGRGRTFFGPLATTVHQDNGTPTEAKRTILQDAADDLIASSSGFGDGAIGVYSRVSNVFRDFTSADVPNEFAVLRSRRD